VRKECNIRNGKTRWDALTGVESVLLKGLVFLDDKVAAIE
jgi:hypothetical protein